MEHSYFTLFWIETRCPETFVLKLWYKMKLTSINHKMYVRYCLCSMFRSKHCSFECFIAYKIVFSCFAMLVFAWDVISYFISSIKCWVMIIWVCVWFGLHFLCICWWVQYLEPLHVISNHVEMAWCGFKVLGYLQVMKYIVFLRNY